MKRRRIAAGVAMVAVVAGVVAVERPNPGPVLRTVALARLPTGMVVDARTGRAFIAAMYGSNAVAGSPAWRRTANDIYVVDTHTGALLRTTNVGGAPWVYNPALAVDEHSSRVFAFGETIKGNMMSVLDAASGRLLRTATPAAYPPSASSAAAGQTSVAVDDRSGRIYVPNSDGMSGNPGGVWVLDGAHGAVLSAVPLNMGLTMMALDERAGRVLVAGEEEGASTADTWGWMPTWLRRLPWLAPSGSRAGAVRAGVSTLDAPG